MKGKKFLTRTIIIIAVSFLALLPVASLVFKKLIPETKATSENVSSFWAYDTHPNYWPTGDDVISLQKVNLSSRKLQASSVLNFPADHGSHPSFNAEW